MIQEQKTLPKKSIVATILILLLLLVANNSVAYAFQDDSQELEISFNEYKGKIMDAKSKKTLGIRYCGFGRL